MDEQKPVVNTDKDVVSSEDVLAVINGNQEVLQQQMEKAKELSAQDASMNSLSIDQQKRLMDEQKKKAEEEARLAAERQKAAEEEAYQKLSPKERRKYDKEKAKRAKEEAKRQKQLARKAGKNVAVVARPEPAPVSALATTPVSNNTTATADVSATSPMASNTNASSTNVAETPLTSIGNTNSSDAVTQSNPVQSAAPVSNNSTPVSTPTATSGSVQPAVSTPNAVSPTTPVTSNPGETTPVASSSPITAATTTTVDSSGTTSETTPAPDTTSTDTKEEGKGGKKRKKKESNLKYYLTFIFLALLIWMIVFLPDISNFVSNYLQKKQQEAQPEITTGKLVCEMNTNDATLDYNYKAVFDFEDSLMKKLTYTTTVKGDPSLDAVALSGMDSSCNLLQTHVLNMNGVEVNCDLQEGTFVNEQILDYELINREELTTAYLEAGGTYPDYQYNQYIDEIEKQMNASNYTCKKESS